jgi:tetratricopeptide (TPR) repeat protein
VAYLWGRRTAQALEYSLQTLDLDPGFPLGLYILGMCYEQQRNYPQAIAAYEKSRAGIARATLGYVYGVLGQRSKSSALLEELQGKADVSPYYLATLHMGLGEKDRAVAELERAYENRDARLVLLKVDFHFDGLRSDPRFQSLLRRIRLTP